VSSRISTLQRRLVSIRRRLWPSASPREGLGLLVYPYDANPYQELLYEAIRATGVDCRVVYVQRHAHLGPIPFLVQVTIARLRGYRLLHLHWPQFALYRGARLLPRLSLLNARLHLRWLRALGIRLVWTVHNAVPHEPETADDIAVSRLLARDAAHKIVHGENAIEELAAIGADTLRLSVIPHGAYSGTYPEADRTESRRTLDLPEGARIVMFFGQIRPYKGLEDLIPAWDEATAGDWVGTVPFLLIAGRCDDDAERARLTHQLAARTGRFDAGYTPHEHVPLYFAAADVVVLPFRQVTTSGSAVLALSLRRPIVAPRLGALRDLPQDVGFLYERGDLATALAQALSATPQELAEQGEAARRYADSLSWDRIAAATLDVYRQAALAPG
jgi:glycosyltransferase involved in cell wall biosynthesis